MHFYNENLNSEEYLDILHILIYNHPLADFKKTHNRKMVSGQTG